MPVLSARFCRELLEYVRAAEAAPDQPVMPQPARWIAALETALRHKRSLGPAKKRREARRQSRRERTAEVRAAVMERADTQCEAGLAADRLAAGWVIGSCSGALELDHQDGGVGRRTQRESVETCWALTGRCHTERTMNLPDAATWRRKFIAHARRHGYEAVARIVERRLPAEASP